MIESVSFKKTIYNKLPFKFEAGTPNISGAIVLGEAVDFLLDIGLENIYNHEANLLDYATNKLKNIDGLKLIGQAEDKSSVISFIVDGIHSFDLGTILDNYGIAVRTGHHCTQPVMDFFKISGTTRASIAMYNTKNEIDIFYEKLMLAIKMLR
jgi:cysteine desulfurase/selenocysteine lyase